MKLTATLIIIMMAMLTASCGQTGSLYLPAKEVKQ